MPGPSSPQPGTISIDRREYDRLIGAELRYQGALRDIGRLVNAARTPAPDTPVDTVDRAEYDELRAKALILVSALAMQGVNTGLMLNRIGCAALNELAEVLASQAGYPSTAPRDARPEPLL